MYTIKINVIGRADVEYELNLWKKACFRRKIYPYDFDENNIFVCFVRKKLAINLLDAGKNDWRMHYSSLDSVLSNEQI